MTLIPYICRLPEELPQECRLHHGENLVLASASPRRAELLRKAGIPFTVRPVEADETGDSTLSPMENGRIIVTRKAEAAAAAAFPGELILAADTLVICENRIFGKPGNLEEATAFLTCLSGKSHSVITWHALVRKSADKDCMALLPLETRVHFKKLTAPVIQRYLELVNPLDKAGAYAIQEHGDMLAEKVEGSVDNVIGLDVSILGLLTQ